MKIAQRMQAYTKILLQIEQDEREERLPLTFPSKITPSECYSLGVIFGLYIDSGFVSSGKEHTHRVLSHEESTLTY